MRSSIRISSFRIITGFSGSTNRCFLETRARQPAMLAAGHSVLPLSFRSFFRRLISEVAWPIVTKLCHMSHGDTDL